MGCINSVPTKNTEDFDSVVTKTDASAGTFWVHKSWRFFSTALCCELTHE